MRHGPEGDIWGLGCIIHEMTAFRSPEIELTESIKHEEAWFRQNGMVVPTRTIQPRRYKAFCHYMAHHPAAPTRIDKAPLTYSKLLNHFMMRTLDVNYQKRITAYGLQRSLPVLETLARNIRLYGQESLLNAFDDGQDDLSSACFSRTQEARCRDLNAGQPFAGDCEFGGGSNCVPIC
ncbi:hypothetical protein JI435_019520 [Parastagonospora nodorum SN15]|uniref:Protein kinase domain-containing protein n=1 Tax=Phaeosphaeria nodorum (strain SN15 / ATCC MYA-4574 / FGSC 10173) TaxID=321614 RepID=A0A7U2EVC5_PHANO|nr:hypothetical protein JI435_019520 [Parastagonospora nodorum SN15]